MKASMDIDEGAKVRRYNEEKVRQWCLEGPLN